jgi:hypothetical protein
MRQGEWELCLVRDDTQQPIPEVQHGGKTYAVAAAGQAYAVQLVGTQVTAFLMAPFAP